METAEPYDVEDESKAIPAGMRYEHGKVVPHLTVEERVARGEAARREVPRSSHAGFTPGTIRPDPVALLESQAGDAGAGAGPHPLRADAGVAVHLLPGCGADHGQRPGSHTPRSGLTTQVCGDAHLMNFGVFASPERRLVFGINDFDETFPGPWEWDVKRLAASFAIAGRDNGYSTKDRKKVLLSAARRVPVGHAPVRGDDQPGGVVLPHRRRDGGQGAAQARSTPSPASEPRPTWPRLAPATACRRFDKLTHVVDGERRIISDPPLIQPIEELVEGMERDQIMEFLRAVLRSYRRHAAERPPPPAGGLPSGPHGPQGRRGGQRRHPSVDRADVRP